jgi:hypothetical protein
VHPFGDLSAYADNALSVDRRAAVEAHLDTCSVCRARLGELRATSRLIAALPSPVPLRRLAPRVSIPVWVAPLRTLSAVATGAAALLFVASAVTSSFSASQSTGGAPAAAPAPNAVQPAGGAGAASSGPPANFQVTPVASPAPAPALNAERSTASSDAAKDASRQDNSAPVALNERPPTVAANPGVVQWPPSPLVWLALAFGFGVLWIVLGWRLRAV